MGLLAAIIWESIRARKTHVVWHKLVCHKLYVPMYSFILWMALHRKLQTLDLVSKFAINVNPRCCLYHTQAETQAHLFFECSYSSTVLAANLSYGGWTNFPYNWQQIISWSLNMQGKHIKKQLRLCLATVLYSVWVERNKRIHDNHAIPAQFLITVIIDKVKSRLDSYAKFHIAKINDSSLFVWSL